MEPWCYGTGTGDKCTHPRLGKGLEPEGPLNTLACGCEMPGSFRARDELVKGRAEGRGVGAGGKVGRYS